ncbi:MAG: hypothetical protein LBT89_12590 [Planctomycetaceae bacterium]|nr:hypothetical protein [Planctomycetaceae bacterium]
MQTEVITSVIQIILSSIILLVLLSSLFYVQRLLKAKLVQPEPKPVDFLLYFKNLKHEGKITPEEFRIIERAVLGIKGE